MLCREQHGQIYCCCCFTYLLVDNGRTIQDTVGVPICLGNVQRNAARWELPVIISSISTDLDGRFYCLARFSRRKNTTTCPFRVCLMPQ